MEASERDFCSERIDRGRRHRKMEDWVVSFKKMEIGKGGPLFKNKNKINSGTPFQTGEKNKLTFNNA